MPSQDYTHISVTKELRDELRKQASESGMTYTGVIRALKNHNGETLSKSDADHLVDRFAEAVAEVTFTTKGDVEDAVRAKLEGDDE